MLMGVSSYELHIIEVEAETYGYLMSNYCDVCDPTRPDKMHPPEFAVDGMESWWQSPPLSRGMKYNEVNLTIELGQEFHVAYVYIKMANSPRPGLWVLEKSADYGKTWSPWQYFSDSPADCETYFGKESLQPITRDDSVICSTEYSKIVPLEGGEIPISLLKKRPSANHYFNSTVLQEWTRATNIRLRFLRTKNLLGHLMSVARQDPTVTRRYFYSIKDISIGGRCMCNGHADACDIPDPRDVKVLLCRCKHNTCGAKCDTCCPGFEQKAWRQSKHNDPFRCEACNCHDHSRECTYDEEVDRQHLSLDIHGKYQGGGVCQNCQHNTEGINCNKCKPKYYRPYAKQWNEIDVCAECHCNYFYSTGNCAEGSGRCECRKEFTPPDCNSCSFGYYDYPNCKPCECYMNGTINLQCSATDGNCTCLPNFGGKYCKECAPGNFNFPECLGSGSPVNVIYLDHRQMSVIKKQEIVLAKVIIQDRNVTNVKMATIIILNVIIVPVTSVALQKKFVTSSLVNVFAKKVMEQSDVILVLLAILAIPPVNPATAVKLVLKVQLAVLLVNVIVFQIMRAAIVTNVRQAITTILNANHVTAMTMDQLVFLAIRMANANVGKIMMDKVVTNVKKATITSQLVKVDCNCHPAGVVAGFAGCGSVPAGELCQCKERVEGRICDKCRPLYWNLSPYNPHGCEECNCNRTGVLGGIAVCDTEDGQCVCKPSVGSRSCSECEDGTYDLKEDNLFGCTDCGCDVGGSINHICNKITGQCSCQSRVSGRTCKEPLQAHYFPTLYQYQYEIEDGHTPENSRVRYAHDENVFPYFSWRGYAVFSIVQKEVIQDIFIYKPSLYRLVLRFVNNNPNTVIGGIRIVPDNPNDIEQYIKVQFRTTSQPAFVTVSGETGNTPKPFVMNPGRWSVSINVNQSVLLDYFVLLPEDFYLATILNQKIESPCTSEENGLCRQYAYPNISMFDRAMGAGGFIQSGNKIKQLKEYLEESDRLDKIGIHNRVPLLNPVQPQITFTISVRKPGPYVIVINYVTPLTDLRTHDVDVYVHLKNGNETGNVKLYSCPYTIACRQAVTNEQGGVAVYLVNDSSINIDLKSVNANVGIHSIYAIPLEDWSLDYIKPKSVCIRKDGECILSTFRNPPETKKIQFEQDVNGEIGKNKPTFVLTNETTYVWLNPSETFIDLKGKVPHPGYYTFIVQYYQPNFPEFDLNITIQNGQFYEAKVPVKHCPSESGCRAVVIELTGNNKFLFTENFMITVKQPPTKNIYLDYLLVIPADLYSDRNLEEEVLDRTGEFIETCGKNHFNVDVTQEGFCRDSVFSITAGHNLGALPCGCDFYGSESFECEKFGGQCHCKDHIIGRKCEACKTGYFGFPDCKPCNCPSTAYCEPTTGQCICPRHVAGERCDQCEPYTFGYDPIIGCEECKCNYLGVNGSVQCNIDSGECPCKQNVIGRTCDTCEAGYYLFPHCESCECDGRGTTPDVCDQVTAECLCKKYVVGPHCDFCREGSFNLQEINDEGCTECFCFGKTTRCESSELVKSLWRDMQNWTIVSLNTSRQLNITKLNLSIESIENENEIGVVFSEFNGFENTAYFSAPNSYLGKRLTSYGGFLNYTIYYSIGSEGTAVSDPDIILQGADLYLTYSNYEQPPPATTFSTTLQLVESNFELPAGGSAKREHIMEVLRDLSWLINVALDEANEIEEYYSNAINIPFANSVERCHCPPNYRGLSCEECAPGYYRIKSGPHGGYCVACQCNGHASDCDVDTGICMNCAHNTRGDHCELCDVGYHGNALSGTPNDCLICACPLPIVGNKLVANVSKVTLELDVTHVHLATMGDQRHLVSDYCKPCQCSGNINPSDPSSCDTVTGDCLRCLNNTSGVACSLCAPGYFGDAIKEKDCQDSDQCDDVDGQCKCKSGVTGRACDRCASGYWNYSSEGCISCGCKNEYSRGFGCNAFTGQCECLQGVCDSCHHALLDDTDKLAVLIDPVLSDFNLLYKKTLASMREQLEKLKPKFNNVYPTQQSIDEILKELESLEQDSKNLNRKSNYSLENSDALRNQSTKLKDKLEVLLDEIYQADDEAERIFEEIEKIPEEINEETGSEIEYALQEGQKLLDEMKVYNLTKPEISANKQLDKVSEVLKNVNNYKLPVEDLQQHVEVIQGALNDFNGRLDDLYNQTQYSLNRAKEAENIIARSG
ncbi:hypothetical protein NQ317_009587 [Molorchus minor]|uniref:Laminin subunit alpha n=1 Tax=Molorchus minor TaxID=1323400 RepID=A0ABQ9J666_9CUCU|nr:hypothetical protein NQ317_009587 [Molorchus minor]